MSDSLNEWTEFFNRAFPSLEKTLKEWMYDGFDSYEDYVKYGDMFDRRMKVTVTYTHVGRQLKR